MGCMNECFTVNPLLPVTLGTWPVVYRMTTVYRFPLISTGSL